MFDTVLLSEELVYVGRGEVELCGGNVGTNGEKWCVVTKKKCSAIGPKRHKMEDHTH